MQTANVVVATVSLKRGSLLRPTSNPGLQAPDRGSLLAPTYGLQPPRGKETTTIRPSSTFTLILYTPQVQRVLNFSSGLFYV